MLNTDVTEGNKAVMTDATEHDGQKGPETKGVLLQVKELTIRTRAGVNLLSDISFHIEPGELVALAGLSRTRKSLLLGSLAGLVKPANGQILVDGINLYANLKSFRSSIGFVPAQITLQQSLTVAEIMQDAASLRLPRAASNGDRKHRVQVLLDIVGLTELANCRVELLSRFERRKLNIAVEMVGFPGLLLVDEAAEAAEQLTPFEEVQITILLRELCRQGITIIQVDHRSRSAGLSDKVIFLVPGGLLAWFGPADEAFIYLRSLVPKGIAKDLFGLREALEVLANPQIHEGIEWAKRFQGDDAYHKYVDDPLHNRYPDLLLQTRPLLRIRLRNSSQEKLPPPIIPGASFLQKLILMISRNARLLWREKSLLSLLVIPPVIALIDFVLSSAIDTNPDRLSIVLGVLIFLAQVTAAVLFHNEISKDKAVYERESRTSSLSFPYIVSKIWLVGLFTIYQGVVWTVIHFIATGLAGGPPVLVPYAITFFFITFIGGIIGLLVSALSRIPTMATNWLLLLTIPQLVFSGSIIPAANLNFPFNLLSAINPSRYAFETLLTTSPYGEGLNISPVGHWWILAIMSFFLILLLVEIQRRVGNART